MQKKKEFYILIGVLVIGSLAYRLIGRMELEQSTLLFMGLPALLAVMIVRFTETPKSAYGAVFRAITLFLLVSAILLGEGVVCVLMTAPIFYAVGAIVVFILQRIKRDKDEDDPLDSGMFAVGFFLLLVFTGVYGDVREKPLQQVVVVEKLDAKLSLDAFNQQVDLKKNLPGFFSLGFPTPLDPVGEGIQVGDLRSIPFRSTTKGVGTLQLEIVKQDQQELVFKVKSDDTHISHWLTWETISVELKSLPQGQTEVRWTTTFKCELGPSWYFVPIERYAVKLSSQHLLNTYFNE